jgi:hypothetical protein
MPPTRLSCDMCEYLAAYFAGDAASAMFHASFIVAP